MAKTKSKPEKTMEERKLDSLRAIEKRLAEIVKLMEENVARKESDEDVPWHCEDEDETVRRTKG